jgi:cupin fold WbuC family metalloprotein
MNGLRERYPDVWYADSFLERAGAAEIAFLKERAARSPRLRARICFHADPAAPIHEMLIVHHRSCYVRPAAHPTKAESIFVLEGAAVAVVFDDAGAIANAFRIGSLEHAETSFWRIPEGTWHSLVIASEWLVFSEVSAGPFTHTTNVAAAWAPPDAESHEYVAELRARLRARGLLATDE